MYRRLVISTLSVAVTLPALVFGQGECADGVVYDDGDFENGYGAKPSAGSAEYVMLFDPPSGARQLEEVCICWTRGGEDSSLSFDINVYALGESEAPGELLGSLPALAFGVPAFSDNRFYSYDMSPLGIAGDAPVFIGAAWDPAVDTDLFICADQDGPSTQPGFTNIPESALSGPPGEDSPHPIDDNFPQYRALGVRAVFDAPCTPGAETLCLNDNRFQVEVDWLQPSGNSGRGQAVPLEGREDSGLFWFFEPANVEMLVKVLDKCDSSFHSFWVFFAATTNVGLTLTVTDTLTGESQVYDNPVGMAALPVQDTLAFQTCD